MSNEEITVHKQLYSTVRIDRYMLQRPRIFRRDAENVRKHVV
jgi:hypothetical protein